MRDDLVLLERWRSGDRAAGETLLRTHHRDVFNWFRKQVGGDADLAGDLTQQVFRVAVENRDDIVSAFRGYLFGIARFKLMEHFRQQRFMSDDQVSQLSDPAHGAFSIMAASDDARLLVHALQSLTVEEQSYLMWSYADKLTQPEIAERVGLTASQVNGRIHRAKEKLRRKLEEQSHSPAQRSSINKGFDTWVISLRRRVEPEKNKEKEGSNDEE